jgi:hypothetical protein
VIKWLAFKETKLIIKNSATIDLIQVTKKNERAASIHMHHEFLLAP